MLFNRKSQKFNRTRTPKKRSSKKSTPNRRSGRKSSGKKVTSRKMVSHKYKPNDEDIEKYVEKVIQSTDTEQVKLAESRQVDDCVYMSKYNDIIKRTPIEQQIDVEHQSRLTGEVHTPGRERDNIDLDRSVKQKFEMTQDNLKASYTSYTGSGRKTSGRKRSRSPWKSPQGPELTTLVLDNEARRHINEYKNQIEYLKLVILSLDVKLKDYDSQKKELENAGFELEKSEQSRRDLHHSIIDNTEAMKQEQIRN